MNQNHIEKLKGGCRDIGVFAGVLALITLARGALALVGLFFGLAAAPGSFVLYGGTGGSLLLAPGGPSVNNQAIDPANAEMVKGAAQAALKPIFIMESATSALGLLGVAGILYLLYRLFYKDLKAAHTPFTARTIDYLRGVGLIVIALGFIPQNIRSIFISLTTGQGFTTRWDLGRILLGVMVLALAHIFEYGAALQQEADETL